MKSKTKVLQILNIIGLVFAITLNALANALPINGYTTGQLSDMYPNLFTPAGITFSIWSIIYLGLILLVIYQAKGLFRSQKQPPKMVSLMGLWFFISSLANGSWIFAWHYEMVWLSVIIMLVLLFSLINIYRNLGIGIREVSNAEKYMVQAPISIYLGWISVATVANITAFLVDLGWGGFGISENVWAATMVLAAAFIGSSIIKKNGDLFYLLVLVWAILGIIYKRLQAQESYPFVLTACIVAILLLATSYLANSKKLRPENL